MLTPDQLDEIRERYLMRRVVPMYDLQAVLADIVALLADVDRLRKIEAAARAYAKVSYFDFDCDTKRAALRAALEAKP